MYISYMHFGQITSVILVYCKTINLPARVLWSAVLKIADDHSKFFSFRKHNIVKINDGVDLSPVMTMAR